MVLSSWAGWCAPFESNDFEKNLSWFKWMAYIIKDLRFITKGAKILGISYDKFYDKKLAGETTREKNFKEFLEMNLIESNCFQVSTLIIET